MSDEPSTAERRVDGLGREAFDLAVTSATKAATQNVARIHRLRLVSWAAAASFLAAAVVFIVAFLIVYSAIKDSDTTNARYNCRVLTRVAQIMGNGAPDLRLKGKPEGFLSSDTLLRQSQNAAQNAAKLRPGPLKALLTDPETARLEKQALAVQQSVTNYWANTLSAQLKQVASVNCARRVK